MSNTFSVTVISTESSPSVVSAQYASVSNGALFLSDDPVFAPFSSIAQIGQPKTIYAAGQWQSAIATTGAST